MRNISLSEGEYYHLYNRGVVKQDICGNDRDRVRLLFSLLYFQAQQTFRNPEFYVNNFLKMKRFDHGMTTSRVSHNRYVELVAFCLMPNHFHALVLEKEAGGIARYMQRVQNAYTKYFNMKYKKSGHLFQGPYKAVHVENNEQLLHLSAYIHKNPFDLTTITSNTDNKITTDEHRVFISCEKYPWSSYADYVGNNRWGDLLVRNIILEQFNTPDAYRKFTITSSAKEKKEI